MAISYTLVAGDTLSFETPAPSGAGGPYRPADGWTLTYRLIPRDGSQSAITLTATVVDNDTFGIGVPAVTTAGYSAGWYSVAAFVTRDADTYTVEPAFDQVEIKPNPRTVASGYDGRSPARKAYDDVVAAINDAAARAQGRGTTATAIGGMLEYQIGDRRVRYSDPDKAMTGLLVLKSAIAIELKRERRYQAAMHDEPDPYRTYLKLGRG
jgi:hypothetical protein